MVLLSFKIAKMKQYLHIHIYIYILHNIWNICGKYKSYTIMILFENRLHSDGIDGPLGGETSENQL